MPKFHNILHSKGTESHANCSWYASAALQDTHIEPKHACLELWNLSVHVRHCIRSEASPSTGTFAFTTKEVGSHRAQVDKHAPTQIYDGACHPCHLDLLSKGPYCRASVALFSCCGDLEVLLSSVVVRCKCAAAPRGPERLQTTLQLCLPQHT